MSNLSHEDILHIAILQRKFHTWTTVPHPRCVPGVCVMCMDFDTSTTISICSKDSHNIHVCTYDSCAYLEENYASNDIVCTLTGVVVRHCNSVPEFVPTLKQRTCRFKMESRLATIDAVIDVAITCSNNAIQPTLRAASFAIRDIIYETWLACTSQAHQLGRATPRKLMFFSATCIFMMRCGIQPHHIIPKIAELASIKKSIMVSHLARQQAMRFTPKTMSDYGTLTLKQISCLPHVVITNLRCRIAQLLQTSGLGM